ncbi:TetR/AcrR family transcriptional regulator [Actinocorallia sp. API 0066]|uniref:TetR/AcrR family transcriptional regulator n=1 Tax=Actinocorallia sp. API 0066 TaxID=2896846 RepID=UPI001E643190|nr:TetR/AcrR family transcriptional regulator [Actinocorallia sp. API 0066]MCD0447757.1 TetR/AcrR family transcriptional regulator [Actinocorallia sp. API 0066]
MADEKTAVRDRILQVGLELLEGGGDEAVSTRAVAAGAGVQQPTLYRLFGDKRGLLDALASYGFERYLASKHQAHASTGNVFEDLQVGWDNHVAFGRERPHLYVLMYANTASGDTSPPAKAAYQALLAAMRRVAATGALRVPADVAAHMIQSAAIGVTLRLIARRDDPALNELSPRVRDAVLSAILVGAEVPTDSTGDVAARALTLDAVLPAAGEILTEPETALLREWLRRLARR